jgi:hypothetical protein
MVDLFNGPLVPLIVIGLSIILFIFAISIEASYITSDMNWDVKTKSLMTAGPVVMMAIVCIGFLVHLLYSENITDAIFVLIGISCLALSASIASTLSAIMSRL